MLYLTCSILNSIHQGSDITDLLHSMECAPQSVMDAIDYKQQRAHNELKRSLIQFLSSAPQFFHLTGESVILGPRAKVAQKMEHDVKVRLCRDRLNQQIQA